MGKSIFFCVQLGVLTALAASLNAAEETGFGGNVEIAWLWLLRKGSAVLVTIVVGIIAWVVLKNLLEHLFERTKMVQEFRRFTHKGLRLGMILVISLAVIQQVGVELGMLWGLISAGIAMVAIGFVAVWSVLSNTTAAFILLMSRPFRIGDTIEVTEATGGPCLKGVLTDISLVYTTVEETGANGRVQQVRIPNNVLLQKSIRVFPASDGGVDLGAHMSTSLMQAPEELDADSTPAGDSPSA